jgi:hypothetical protein
MFLHIARCGDDHHDIHPAFTAGFEQQRDIKHCGPGAGRPGPRQKPGLFPPNHGVQNLLQ